MGSIRPAPLSYHCQNNGTKSSKGVRAGRSRLYVSSMVNPKICVPGVPGSTIRGTQAKSVATHHNGYTISNACHCIGHKCRVDEIKHTPAISFATMSLVVKIGHHSLVLELMRNYDDTVL